MADVTGPIGSLPGAAHAVPDGMVCDDHPDRPATFRVQGETDSMGCEMHDMCDECFEQYKVKEREWREAEKLGPCDWCKCPSNDLRHTRDYEEGMNGRVYMVCGDCRANADREAEEELRHSDPHYFDDDRE